MYQQRELTSADRILAEIGGVVSLDLELLSIAIKHRADWFES